MKKKMLTKMKNKFVPGVLVLVIVLFACKSAEKKNTVQAESNHYVEIRQLGIGMISLDKVPNEMVLQKSAGSDYNKFFSYAVSFRDSSLITDQKKQLEMGKYYQYDMHKDWIALVNGDSVRPVFFQPGVKKTVQVNEGIIVFEIPSGIEPDTLFFSDSYGAWGQHQIFLNK